MVSFPCCKAYCTGLILNSTQYNASSLLLRLPQEIKNMIYGYVIGEEVIHVQPESSVQFDCHRHVYPKESYICTAMTPFDGFDRWSDKIADLAPQEAYDAYEDAWAIRHHRCYGYKHGMITKQIWEVPAILLTCRQVYLEARLIIYKEFTFMFKNLKLLVR